MKIEQAYLCMDCSEIGTCSMRCPKCTSKQVWPISLFLNRKVA